VPYLLPFPSSLLFADSFKKKKKKTSPGQAHKQSLSNCVVDEDLEAERHFSSDMLRQLFTLNETTECDTHDTFKCKRCMKGRQVTKPEKSTTGATGTDTSTWNHWSSLELHKMPDTLLRDVAAKTGSVSFVFQYKTDQLETTKT
jgi:DNA repair and recombination RAD54-like protein